MVIHGLEYFNPDPYDVPPERLLRTYRLLDELYWEFRMQLLHIRLVSKTWNEFAQPFIHSACTVATLVEDAQVTQLARAIRIVVTPFFVPCDCWFGDPCPPCEHRRNQRGNFDQILSVDDRLSVEVLDDADMELITAMNDSSHRFQNLLSLQVQQGLPLPGEHLHAVSGHFPALVSLDFEWYSESESGESTYIGLNLPNLKSLRITGNRGESFSIDDWKVPKLTAIMLEFLSNSIEDMVARISRIGSNLKVFSLSEWSRFDPTQPTALWTTFPNVIALSTPIKFLLAYPPPLGHPIQYFRTDDEDIGTNRDEMVASSLLALVMKWPTCRGVMGWFKWKLDFDQVLRMDVEGDKDDDEPALRSLVVRLKVGAQLDALGVRYDDSFGLTYAQAKDKFGSPDGEDVVAKYLDMAEAALG
ncbi:hypothetical protein M408DRAFT_263208 [Serendipita vermifera MAFF 305830]|uniref:Uncharacterized protein n=1 Tax=Serendipita vermifera MAFF 305830 TaxID=933852 RepID=A0A0C3AVU4_SERVB|nr:hypothetical protein M408DRAFT_263208 [Serendipita vermifera MAFF 305830]